MQFADHGQAEVAIAVQDFINPAGLADGRNEILVAYPACFMRKRMDRAGSGKSTGKCLVSQASTRAKSTSKRASSGKSGAGSWSKNAESLCRAAFFVIRFGADGVDFHIASFGIDGIVFCECANEFQLL
jgi:hypothetical protein